MLNIANSTIQKKDYLTGDSSFLIDFIRVLACEMVVFCHPFFIYNTYFNLASNNTNLLYTANEFLGDTGVVLFFIVSGIVISNSLFKKIEDNISYGFMNFVIDRFSRIYSGLAPCLIFILFCDLTLLAINSAYFYKFCDNSFSISALLGSLLMLQNLIFVGIQAPPFAGVIWTLNIEWWLYLSFGWMVVNLNRKRKMDAIFFVPLFLFSFYPLQVFLIDSRENLPFVWFMGVVATIIYIYTDINSLGKWLDFTIIALIVFILGRLVHLYFHNERFYDITLELLLTFLIIMLMAKLKNTNRFDKTRIKIVIKFMGKYSFTLYLIHYVIENLIFAFYLALGIKYSLLVVFIVSIVISNITAIVIAYPTEMRYKRLANFLNDFVIKYTKKNHTLRMVE